MSVDIVVPEVGESIVDARVARWLKKEGDTVAAGEPLVELETDKIDVEVTAPKAGVLARIAHADGADVKIGAVLGTIEPGAPAAVARDFSPASGAGAPGARASQERPASAGHDKAAAPSPPGAPATPSARRLARAQDVALEAVAPSGPRLTKADVERTIATSGAPGAPAAVARDFSPASPSGAPGTPATVARDLSPASGAATRGAGTPRREERVRMSRRRATIARRLVEAQHAAAMLTTFNEVDMGAVMELRARQKETFAARHGVSLGIVSFFVRAVVVALRDFPRLNAEIAGDEMVLKHYYDIGIAVGAAEGLVVPVLRDADRMPFAAIELGIREFARKANEGTLTLEDIRGGTFSITNGGVYGSLMSTPILNPPQVGILGLHVIKDRPVSVGGEVRLRPMMYTALTYDHRIVDGAEAVRFLVRIKELVEDPGALLVEA
jgi:2-oxoglutarate dehydrogenase E2 component (dihydrolipoamide succinyltransferase)